MLRAQVSQKRHFDSHHSPLIFLPGDWAMLVYSGTLKRPHKLAPSGTVVQILEAISPVAYRIRVPTGSRMHDVVSIEHLRRYRLRSPSSGSPPATDSPDVSVSVRAPSPPAVAPLASRLRDGRREIQVRVGDELVWKLDRRPLSPDSHSSPPAPRRSPRLLGRH